MSSSRGRALRGTLFAALVFSIALLLVHRSSTKQRPRSGATVVDEDNVATKSTIQPPTLVSTQASSNSYASLINAQKQLCGELCDATSYPAFKLEKGSKVTVESLQRSVRRVPLSCDHYFTDNVERVLEPRAFEWPPPSSIPSPMLDDYTLGGRIEVKPYFLQSRYSEGDALESKWTKELVQSIMSELVARRHHGTYGVEVTNHLQDILTEAHLEGKSVLVIGSEKPWLEIACLRAGARKVTTIEYGRIYSEVAELQTMIPSEASKMHRDRTLEPFDVIVSYSSLEHAGLGRYGDGLNPWGDVIAVAKAWCMSKKDARLILGLPFSSSEDMLFYNAHRVYGLLRWPLVLTNWQAEKVHTKIEGHLIVEASKVS